ncbi:MAG: hypothetical protein JNL21_01350 [Myxococcales bacterium]|nr:hypothetical protein [Myxococcales bacterium]
MTLLGRSLITSSLALALSLGLGPACTPTPPATEGSTSLARSSAQTSAPPAAPPSAADAAPSASAKRAAEAEAKRFSDLVNDLSEPDTYFFSDNLITNETSYLQIADELQSEAPAGSVYLGVGPEQNFSYIARARPSMAFVVDIRRANTLLHLLYRAAFESAESRAHFVALLLGRAHDTEKTNAADASVDAVFAAATTGDASEATFTAAHDALMKLVRTWGVKLTKEDEAAMKKMHHAFFEDQLAIRFELHEKNGRAYPTLREILQTRSPSDKSGSFLASEDDFRFVQTMQREGRVVPIVGDFAGDHALPQLASYLQSEGKSVGVFYVSNVEQYLLEPKAFAKWVRNVRALPKTDKSLFVRAYLDQGRKHPEQMKGHRTATVLARITDFEKSFGDKATTTFWALCTENKIASR